MGKALVALTMFLLISLLQAEASGAEEGEAKGRRLRDCVVALEQACKLGKAQIVPWLGNEDSEQIFTRLLNTIDRCWEIHPGNDFLVAEVLSTHKVWGDHAGRLSLLHAFPPDLRFYTQEQVESFPSLALADAYVTQLQNASENTERQEAIQSAFGNALATFSSKHHYKIWAVLVYANLSGYDFPRPAFPTSVPREKRRFSFEKFLKGGTFRRLLPSSLTQRGLELAKAAAMNVFKQVAIDDDAFKAWAEELLNNATGDLTRKLKVSQHGEQFQRLRRGSGSLPRTGSGSRVLAIDEKFRKEIFTILAELREQTTPSPWAEQLKIMPVGDLLLVTPWSLEWMKDEMPPAFPPLPEEYEQLIGRLHARKAAADCSWQVKYFSFLRQTALTLSLAKPDDYLAATLSLWLWHSAAQQDPYEPTDQKALALFRRYLPWAAEEFLPEGTPMSLADEGAPRTPDTPLSVGRVRFQRSMSVESNTVWDAYRSWKSARFPDCHAELPDPSTVNGVMGLIAFMDVLLDKVATFAGSEAHDWKRMVFTPDNALPVVRMLEQQHRWEPNELRARLDRLAQVVGFSPDGFASAIDANTRLVASLRAQLP